MRAVVCACHRTNAREELRLQAGTLRFDLNTLIAQKDKPSRKAAEALKKDFLLKVGSHCSTTAFNLSLDSISQT